VRAPRLAAPTHPGQPTRSGEVEEHAGGGQRRRRAQRRRRRLRAGPDEQCGRQQVEAQRGVHRCQGGQRPGVSRVWLPGGAGGEKQRARGGE
jgi:hypothetical protein